MPNLKTILWLLIRKEGDFNRIDWASVFALVVYTTLVLLIVVPIIWGIFFFDLQGLR
ncbi:MAG: hypothetical protein KDA84_00710 [Planctomycetaceae bacterium]|nr:hypothetical protein [Planctomycetaceae bacterium]